MIGEIIIALHELRNNLKLPLASIVYSN